MKEVHTICLACHPNGNLLLNNLMNQLIVLESYKQREIYGEGKKNVFSPVVYRKYLLVYVCIEHV